MIKKLLAQVKLVEQIKGIILSNVIVRIVDRDSRQVYWSCSSGEWKKNKFNLDVDVEQDIDLITILKEISNLTEVKK
jgi:hypothetical protein